MADIDEFCRVEYEDGHRTHLGASLIGDECARKLWYIFRWTFKESFHGRQLRLFDRGHREEERFTLWLKGIGAQVWDKDTNGEQFRISDVMGHFGGSLDGIAILPPKYNFSEPVLLEYKTNKSGSDFNKLIADGMRVAKPNHFAQTSTYGGDPKYRFRYCLYLNINKNDDAIHTELVELDHGLGQEMRNKARVIILSQEPPEKISKKATFFKCKMCGAKDICHAGLPVEKNCRSCVHARPVEDKQWFCNNFNSIIPKAYIANGCPQHNPIA